MELLNDRHYLEPPDNEARILCKCCVCTKPVYEGYPHFNVYGDIFCEDCGYKEFFKEE